MEEQPKYTEQQQKPVIDLIEAISQYKEGRQSFDLPALQDLRERISLNLFLCSDIYSLIRSDAEGSDFIRKREVAKEEERIRYDKDPNTTKRLTVSQISNRARESTQAFEEALVEANRAYYKIRLMIDSASHILHSISSRINQISK